ncbi:MAG: polysaccharide biosynthesis protein [Parcubacteria group bacterium Athens1014_10]|nr:MAG: polysaccharide biosynthesis protein [Parcubacteria group bacterium Athens1014_10]TSD04759.1 MAG: polysaccharide biosynthesis protein [Parcubacteria group bacterium Athens0714_12]
MLSLKKLILKNTLWSGIGEIISKGIQFLLIIILARYLSAADFGKFSFVFSFVPIFLIIADFGLHFISIREISRNLEQTKKYLSNIFTIKLILAFLAFLSIFIISQFLGKNNETKILIYIYGLYTILWSFCEFFYTIFKAWEKFKYEALIKTTHILTLFTFITLLILNHKGLKEIILAYLFAISLIFIIVITIIAAKFTKFHLSFDAPLWKHLFKESWPLALSSVFAIIYYRIDTTMISLMKGDQDTAWYFAPYNLVFGLTFIPLFMMHSFYPKMSQIWHQSLLRQGFGGQAKNQLKILYRKIMLLIGGLAGLMLIGIYFLADKIIILLYGSQYTPSILALKILVIAVFFSYFSHVFLFTLTAMNQQKIYTYITAVGCAFNLIANFIFIPKYSFIGASWTTVATELITGLLLLIFVTKLLKNFAPAKIVNPNN